MMSLNLRTSGTPLTQPQLDSNFTFLFGRDITGTTVSGNTVFLKKQDGTSLSFSLGSFTGNTSASCVTDLYVSNIHGCSPITIHDSIQSVGSSATGITSFAFGNNVNASGDYSHAEGYVTTSSGIYSHAEGYDTKAVGQSSHAEGRGSVSLSSYSHAEGEASITGAYGYTLESVASGVLTINGYGDVSGQFSSTVILDDAGTYYYYTISATTFFGSKTYIYLNDTSVNSGTIVGVPFIDQPIGADQTIGGSRSHTEGFSTQTVGNYSHTEGQVTLSLGDYSHAEGQETISKGQASHAEGTGTISLGPFSHAEGYATTATGDYSHAEGGGTTSTGLYSHAEGDGTTSEGNWSHAEGRNTQSFGDYSHAEGYSTKSVGDYSHSQGVATISSGYGSFASGSGSTAYGITSFIHSTDSIVTGDRSVVLGGQGISGSSSDYVYVSNLNIYNQPNTHTGTTSQVLVRNNSTGNIEVKNIGNVYSCVLGINSTSQPPAGIIPSVLPVTNGGIADKGTRVTGYTQIVSNGIVSTSTGAGNYVTSPPSCSFGTFNNNSGVFTITQAGLYLIEGSIHLKPDNGSSVYWQTGSTNTFGLGIHPANNTDIYAGNYMTVLPNIHTEIDLTVSTLFYADGTNDFVSIKHLNWTNRNYNGTTYTFGDSIRFSITKVY